ncbi:MAG: ATP-binding cassette domain-containing protein [Firmicutes bacterium]|nr:ATP-binding cassette domain-containing protein [Bacillota bacterium]
MDYIIETKNLTKDYKGFLANDNVSIQIPKGAVHGLIGRNGAGKTTLMKMILGFSNRTGGTIIINGKEDEASLWAERSKIGSIIETPAFYDEMTCFANLMYHAKLIGYGDKSHVMEILRRVGLERFKGRKVKAFSLGMRQKLGIACAILGKPEFLMLDEPTNGLDPVSIAEIRTLLLDINEKDGVTILISSHILGEMEKLASSFSFMLDGKLVDSITKEELEEKNQDLETYFLEMAGGVKDE